MIILLFLSFIIGKIEWSVLTSLLVIYISASLYSWSGIKVKCISSFKIGV